MTLNVWTAPSGYSFGTFQESVPIDINLPILYNTDPSITFTVISGKLPDGLVISNRKIVGIAYEVARATEFKFCIRASNSIEISDRTFIIKLEGADPPTFITDAGLLRITSNDQLYVVDSTEVDFQLEAYDLDTAAGQVLSYFIASGDGELPPGLSLSKSGKISGYVEPAMAILASYGDGSYDTNLYDAAPYDFAVKSNNGYETYDYDTKPYDFSLPTTIPKKLNRTYEFRITITDGDSYTKRLFRIFVVSEDYFRADSTGLINDENNFKASVTNIHKPVWKTQSDLGSFRADNYLLIPLEVYDTENVVFSLADLSALPTGLNFDQITGSVYGLLPYQPAITKRYTFTASAIKTSDSGETAIATQTFTLKIVGELDSIISWKTTSDLGSIYANTASTIQLIANCTDTAATIVYRLSSGTLPPGLTLDINGDLVGVVNQYATDTSIGLFAIDNEQTTFDLDTTTFERIFNFTVIAKDQNGVSENPRTFKLVVISPSHIKFSNITAKPFLTPTQRAVWHDFIYNNAIFTQANIYRMNDKNFGIQDSLTMLIYAGIETKEVGAYISAMGLNHKIKQFAFGELGKAISIDPITSEIVYEVVFINLIDPMQKDGKSVPLSIQAASQSSAVTVDNGSDFWNTTVDMVTAGDYNRPLRNITVDSAGYKVSNANPSTYFPNTISNWRKRIKQVGASEPLYLPQWMRSIQPSTRLELGYIPVIPLCYCKPGMADAIILNIKNSGFDFKVIDYTIDRFIINAVDGYTSDKYLVFKNERITI